MFRGRFFGVLLVILLLALLIGGAATRSAYRAGWSEGLVAGQTADGGEVPSPSGPNYDRYSFYGSPRYGFSPFGWFFGGLLKFFVLFLALGLIFKLFGLFLWRGGERRHRYWHPRDGTKPPWDDDPADEPILKV